MKRQEAINAMVEGKKVTHRNFTDDEYLEMDKITGNIFDEGGCCWGGLYSTGMKIRKGGIWETDWEIFNS